MTTPPSDSTARDSSTQSRNYSSSRSTNDLILIVQLHRVTFQDICEAQDFSFDRNTEQTIDFLNEMARRDKEEMMRAVHRLKDKTLIQMPTELWAGVGEIFDLYCLFLSQLHFEIARYFKQRSLWRISELINDDTLIVRITHNLTVESE